MAEFGAGMRNMYEKQNKREKRYGEYGPALVAITVGATGAMMPAPTNLYVWGAGAVGLAFARQMGMI